MPDWEVIERTTDYENKDAKVRTIVDRLEVVAGGSIASGRRTRWRWRSPRS